MKNVSGIFLLGIGMLFLFLPQVDAQNIVAEGSSLEAVTSGYEFTEGPYWHSDGYLLFSDIPANTIYKWTPGSKDAEVFMKPSGHSNGITATPEGMLVLAQHDGKVSIVDWDKNVTTVADSYNGKRLNSPNDVTVASDGTIYFSDPPFGVSEEERELLFGGVYMLKPNGTPQLQFDGFSHPNGVVLSPDESKLYVNDSSTGQILAFDRSKDGSLTNKRKFAKLNPMGDSGGADGMVVDSEGRLYSTGPSGVSVFSPDGKRLTIIEMPAQVTNADWGGADLNQLYLTTPSTIYRLEMAVTGFKK